MIGSRNMKNNRGIILSVYVYILLVFFLLVLATLLMILNNTKLLSNRLKSSSDNILSADYNDFNIILIGDETVVSFLGEQYTDEGYIAKTAEGADITANVVTDINTNVAGVYTYEYTVGYEGITKTVTRTVYIISEEYNYSYNGSYSTFIAPVTGYYEVELWGAQGGNYSTSLQGGKGGYTSGFIKLNEGDTLYVYVGGQPASLTSGTVYYSSG